MLTTGTLVKFSWWSNYKAPSYDSDDGGHSMWYELIPGDTGIIVSSVDDDSVVVFFTRVSALLRVHRSMLVIV